MKRRKHCLTLDLKNDPQLIEEYLDYHKNVWPEVLKSIKDSGVESLELYLLDTRLFMIMEVNDTFSFEEKAKLDAKNQKVVAWEELMWKYQQPWPTAKKGEKWMLMENIFTL